MRRALVIVMIALQRGSAGKAGFSSLQYLSKVCLRLHQLQTPKPQTLDPKPKRLTRCVPPRAPMFNLFGSTYGGRLCRRAFCRNNRISTTHIHSFHHYLNSAKLPKPEALNHIHIYIHTHIHTHMHTHTVRHYAASVTYQVYIYVCIYTHTHTYIHTCIHTPLPKP